MGCKYCVPSDNTYGSDVLIGTNSGMFTIMDDRLVFTSLWEHDSSVRTQSETRIRYCPVCGRDLLMDDDKPVRDNTAHGGYTIVHTSYGC